MYVGYGWSSVLGGRYAGGVHRRIHEFKRPSSLLWSMDAITAFIYAFDSANRVDYRHISTTSTVFLDGHGERRPQPLPIDNAFWVN